MRCSGYFILLICLWPSLSFAKDAGKLVLGEDFAFSPLDKVALDFRYVDEDHKAAARDIADQFFDNDPKATLETGDGIIIYEGIHDISLHIDNHSGQEVFYLENIRPFANSLDIVVISENAYSQGGGQLISRVHSDVDSWHNGIIGSSIFVAVPIPKGQSRLVIRAEIPSAWLKVTYGLHSQASAFQKASMQWLLGPCSYGAIAALIFYAALTGVRLRSKAHLFYIGYALMCVLSNFTSSGWGSIAVRIIIGNGGVYNFMHQTGFLIFGHLIGASAAFFMIEFFDLKEKSHRWSMALKIYGVVCLVLALLTALLMPVMGVTGYYIGQITKFNGTLMIIIMFCVTGHQAIKGSRPAQFFLPGLLLVAGGSAIWINSFYNEMHSSIFTIYAGTLGLVGEMILLSLALSDKVQTTLELQHRDVSKLSMQLQSMNESLHETVRERTRDIGSILDSVSQGLMPIESRADGRFCVSETHSRSLTKLIGPNVMQSPEPFHNFLEATSLNAETKSLIHTALVTSLGEDELQFSINSHVLPQTTELLRDGEKRIFDLEWLPILTDDMLVTKILLVIDDVTAKIAMEEQNREQTALMTIIMQSIPLADYQYQDFIKYAGLHLEEASQALSTPGEPEAALSWAMRPLHTLKGLARNYGFTNLSAVIHDAESALTKLRGRPADLRRWQTILGTITTEVTMVRVVNEQQLKRAGQNTLSLSADTLKGWAERISINNLPKTDLNLLAREIQSHYRKTLPQIIEADLLALSGIARDLHKPEPLVTFAGDGDFISEENHAPLKEAFVHILRNAMDHGIEEPAVRKGRNKPEVGTICIQGRREEDALIITVHDDGQGVDVNTIGGLALERGLVRKDDLTMLSPIGVVQLLFTPGFSTRTTVSDLSGRGVGLDSVRHAIEKVGGEISIFMADDQSSAVAGRIAIAFKIRLADKPNNCVAISA